MYHLFFYAISALLLPLLVGYPIACALRSGLGLRRVIFGEVLGFGVLIIAIRSLETVLPIRDFAWILFGCTLAATVIAWCFGRWDRRLLSDLRRIGPVALVAGVISIACAMVLLNLPVLVYHALEFEGSANHDSFYYTLLARYLESHSFYEPVSYSAQQPYNWILWQTFGWGAPIGRVGAEGYLAWWSLLFNRDPALLYNALSTCGVIGVGLSSLLLLARPLQRALRGRLGRAWLVPLALLVPAFYETSFNSNYATIFGLMFFSAYLAASWERRGWRSAVVAIILITALFASYPELVPMAWLCLGLALLLRWQFRPARFWRNFTDGLRILRNIVGSAVVMPWIAIPAGFVIANAYFVMRIQSHTQAYLDPYQGLAPARYILSFLMMNRQVGGALSEAAAVAVLAVLTALVITAIRRSGKNAFLLAGVCLAFLLVALDVYLRTYNYGKLKVAEYFAPVLVPVMIIGGLSAFRKNWRSIITATASRVALVAIAAVCGYSVYFLVLHSLHWGKIKRITPNTMALASALHALPTGSLVAFGPTPWPYYYSMWIPYLSGASFLYSGNTGSGGYFSSYAEKHPLAPLDRANYLVQSPDAWIGKGATNGSALRFGRFELARTTGVNSLATTGLYTTDAPSAWMGPVLQLSIRHADPNADYVNVFFKGRFHPSGPTERVNVSINGARCFATVNTGGQGVSLNLGSAATDSVTITPTAPVTSPRKLGLSADPRLLSFTISELGFSKLPKYELATCHP